MNTTQIVLIVIIGLLIIAYPILMIRRNKKQNQQVIEQANSLKRGDKVLTTSGVYGKIVDLKKEGEAQQVVIETGTDKYKSYMTVDAYSIYTVLNDKPAAPVEVKPAEKDEKKAKSSKKEKKAEEKSAPVAEQKVQVAEVKVSEVKTEGENK